MILLKQISHYYREAEPFVKVSDADIEKIDNSVLVRAILSKYREDQAREPAGSPGSIGGQFASEGGLGAAIKVTDDIIKECVDHANTVLGSLSKRANFELAHDVAMYIQGAAQYQANQDWYKGFRPNAEKLFGEDEPLFAAIFAATSQQMTPESNLDLALVAYEHFKTYGNFNDFDKEYFQELRRADPSIRAKFLLKDVDRNLKRIGEGNSIVGPKVTAYLENLQGNPEPVTIDSRMVRNFQKWAAEVPPQEKPGLRGGKTHVINTIEDLQKEVADWKSKYGTKAQRDALTREQKKEATQLKNHIAGRARVLLSSKEKDYALDSKTLKSVGINSGWLERKISAPSSTDDTEHKVITKLITGWAKILKLEPRQLQAALWAWEGALHPNKEAGSGRDVHELLLEKAETIKRIRAIKSVSKAMFANATNRGLIDLEDAYRNAAALAYLWENYGRMAFMNAMDAISIELNSKKAKVKKAFEPLLVRSLSAAL